MGAHVSSRGRGGITHFFFFFFFFSQVLNLPGCCCTLFLGLWFVCLSASQRKHGVVDMAEPVVKPGGYRQFSCQTVDGADKTALSRC